MINITSIAYPEGCMVWVCPTGLLPGRVAWIKWAGAPSLRAPSSHHQRASGPWMIMGICYLHNVCWCHIYTSLGPKTSYEAPNPSKDDEKQGRGAEKKGREGVGGDEREE
jgi:hypothetical protein